MPELCILVVDDDRVDRIAVRRALQRAPLDSTLHVEEADSTAAALAAVGRCAFDCVLLDLHLPGGTGLELLATLRAAEDPPPVVMLTGHGDEQTAVAAMKAGAADYLTKGTLEPERLARSILHAVRTRGAERAAADARARLAAAEERYRFLADSIPQMVWVTTETFEVEYVNRQWVEYTGVSVEGMQREVWTSLVHPDDRDALLRHFESARATANRVEMQVRLRRLSDGEYRWHLSRAERMSSNDGVTRWFGTSTDIEEQKRAEAELVRMRDVAERERARAEESNDAKDRFLAILSHELRTPLNAILGWVNILRAGAVPRETVDRGLAIVDRNARTQTQLIEDLLDVSRIVAGKLAIERRTIDLADVCAAAFETVQPLATAKSVSFEMKRPTEALPVVGDPARLQQVIWNLLVNAVKFTPAGERVELTLQREGPHAVIRVSDTGAGIDPAFLPHVFDRFRQAEPFAARVHGGLGLGLSIVRHLVERHDGSVIAASGGPGQGSTFRVTLPLERQAPVATPVEADPAPVSLGGVHVLVVDDDDDSREMLIAALEYSGAIVRGAPSVAHARKELASQLPDIVISDVGMPEEDGYHFVEELRRRPAAEGGRIPAIALTGYAGLEDQRRARAAGFDQHLSKPVDLDKLPLVIARALGHRPRTV